MKLMIALNLALSLASASAQAECVDLSGAWQKASCTGDMAKQIADRIYVFQVECTQVTLVELYWSASGSRLELSNSYSWFVGERLVVSRASKGSYLKDTSSIRWIGEGNTLEVKGVIQRTVLGAPTSMKYRATPTLDSSGQLHSDYTFNFLGADHSGHCVYDRQ